MKLPLPIYESVKIGEQGDFDIVVGLDKNLVEQLKKYSADKSDLELQKNTYDWGRFVEGTYENWYKKGRVLFGLVHKSGVLAAMVRIGPKALFEDKKDWHTIAWRSYKPFRGTGIMKPFTKFSMEFYLKYFPDCKFWLTSRRDNIGSIYLAEFLGFKIEEDKSKQASAAEGRETVVMIK